MTSQHPHLSHPKYRPDIDGLRAIAVLSVVVFHSFPRLLKGGFIGVDVFFVISGYLISTIIFENLDKGTFSFSEFYARRIKRIFPALTLVLAACFAFGWFALLADEYKQLGKHMAAGAAFVSNLVYLKEAGYFDAAAETKPLLHLWSLGIEEQFYIVWPLLLWLAWKRNFNLLTLTILVSIVSFILNIKGINQNAIATFYSPQTRFWELLSGSLLAWATLYRKDAYKDVKSKIDSCVAKLIHGEKTESNNTLSNVLSFLGFISLICGFLGINKKLDFPGIWALVPVLGAMLIIAAGSQAWVNRKILSNKVVVWFGLISYPLYLWHWPLLSFARIVEGKVPSRNIQILAVTLSIVLAWLTFKLVEKPIRSDKHTKLTVVTLVVLMAIIGVIGFVAYTKNGLVFRSIVQRQSLDSGMLNWSSDKTAGCEAKLGTSAMFCLELGDKNKETIAVIGDSTANSLAPGLYEKFHAKKGEGLINFGSGGCPPIRGLVASNTWGGPNTSVAPNCVEVMNHAYSYILKNPQIKTVVLVIFARDLPSWGIPNLSSDDSSARFEKVKSLLDRDIDELVHSGKKVIVSYDMPLYPINAHSCFSRFHSNFKCSVPETKLIDRKPYLELFNSYFMNKPEVCVVKTSNVLIVNHNAPFFDENGVLMIRDDHHLSYHGSRLVAQEFENQGCILQHQK